jgi:pimeloyl-ACP methyl ester carboxylesterase
VPGYRYHLIEVAGFNGTDPAGYRTPGPLIRPLAEEVARYIGEQRLRGPAVVGHSLGGLMALKIAARHPNLVRKAMVVDMPAFNGMNFGGLSATVESVRAMAPSARQRYFGDDLTKSRKNTENLYAAFVQNEAARPAILKQALSSDREVAGRIFEETFSLDLRDEIRAIRAPLTVVYTRAPNQPAAHDRTDEMFRLAYQAVPRAKLRRVNDSGHFIMIDQPQAFRAELRGFLRR